MMNLNRSALNTELEAAHKNHLEPVACKACYAADRKRTGAEFQMYRCAKCVRDINAARLNLWRAQWKIFNAHMKALDQSNRTGRLDAEWLQHRMHHLEAAALTLKGS